MGASPDVGFSGIATSSVEIVLVNKTAGVPACQKGDTIRLSGAGYFADYFVQDRAFDTYTTSFTAYDSCCKLDKEFDNSNFDEKDSQGNIKLYTEAEVLSAMRYQTGLSIGSPTSTGEKYAKGDLSGTCRSILEAMADVNGGMWVCNVSNQLSFVEYTQYLATAAVDSFAEVLSDNSATSFEGLVVTDMTYDKTWSYGSGNVFKYIQSNLIKNNSSVGGELYNRFRATNYASFTMRNAMLSTTFSGLVPQQITYPTDDQGHTASATVLNITARYTAAGWMCDFSSPECQPPDESYQSRIKRELDKTVKKDEKMGVFFLNETGSGVRIKL